MNRERIDTVLKLSEDPEAWYHLGVGELDLAVDQLGFVIAQDPRQDDANRRLGVLLAHRGDLVGSIRCWRQVVAGAGGADLGALTALGLRLSNAGEHAEALQILYDVA